MKQPDLGRKITELRKAKGLTQEELVEKCNVSVRTIQRIESGEVMPRSFTVKTILAALDYEFSDVVVEEDEVVKPASSWFRNMMLIDIDLHKPSDFLIRQLHLSWIFGVLYFILGFLESAAEYLRFWEDGEMAFGNSVYIAIKIAVLISYVFFLRGFILIGGLFNNYLLRIISVVLISAGVLVLAYDIVSVFYDSVEREFVLLGESLAYGAMGVVYGVALRRLDKNVGRIAELAGIFEIAAACFFLTMFLAFVGLIIQTPAVLFEIILIFKVIEIVKGKERGVDV